jgi:sigma-B regulation protein RsbU (phosphoserine phosphatase)
MQILVAEDQTVSRRILEASLRKWGYEVKGVEDGTRAWEILQGEEAPQLAILDWLMPGMDGIEICRQIRLRPQTQSVYIILLTARSGREDKIHGLEAGADDYITKPFDRDELRAPVQVGIRVLELQGALAQRVRQLEEALSRVKQLQGLLPICSYCKKIRNDRNYGNRWKAISASVQKLSSVMGFVRNAMRSTSSLNSIAYRV